MEVTVIHDDHGLLPCHVDLIKTHCCNEDGFFIKIVPLSPEVPSLKAGLFGPLEGDEPQVDGVFYKIRGTRSCASRFVDKPSRDGRFMVVIGEVENTTITVYTAYGSVNGVVASREPGDLNLDSWEAVVEARQFWAVHALANDT